VSWYELSRGVAAVFQNAQPKRFGKIRLNAALKRFP
jgi:hypothetical protein